MAKSHSFVLPEFPGLRIWVLAFHEKACWLFGLISSIIILEIWRPSKNYTSFSDYINVLPLIHCNSIYSHLSSLSMNISETCFTCWSSLRKWKHANIEEHCWKTPCTINVILLVTAPPVMQHMCTPLNFWASYEKSIEMRIQILYI